MDIPAKYRPLGFTEIRWTEGVVDDGAAILRDGQPISIGDLLDILNKAEWALRETELRTRAYAGDENWPLASGLHRVAEEVCLRIDKTNR